MPQNLNKGRFYNFSHLFFINKICGAIFGFSRSSRPTTSFPGSLFFPPKKRPWERVARATAYSFNIFYRFLKLSGRSIRNEIWYRERDSYDCQGYTQKQCNEPIRTHERKPVESAGKL
ncbi:hypothetical protein OS493_020175 [Desmophyllum pertusum]|uniref:Uncharacterized protein n=1 Tax=Desmophyllum pertusum TaxID=174260 RepID=A0A9X0A134_9CNID|nr:hypothetical protein OS493_020175 [Desmophyllum pertusum]